MNKRKLIVGLIILISLGLGFQVFIRAPALDAAYFILRCSIFDRSGKLIFQHDKYEAWCDYGKNGEILVADEIRGHFALLDKDGKSIFETNERVHHWPSFSSDGSELQVKTYVKKFLPEMGFESDVVCLSRRSLKNDILKEWCVDQHFSELKEHGFDLVDDYLKMMRKKGVTFDMDRSPLPHLNSFYEIPENANQNKIPAFAPGNFLVNFYKPTRGMIILDHNLEKILWSWSLTQVSWGGISYSADVHDPQVLENGNIIMYIDQFRPNPGENLKVHFLDPFLDYRYLPGPVEYNYEEKFFSLIVEVDPVTKNFVWQFLDDPKEAIWNQTMGRVRKLKNGNYMFNINNNISISENNYPLNRYSGGHAVIVNANGEKLWLFANPLFKREGHPDYVQDLRPLYDVSFLKARGLIH